MSLENPPLRTFASHKVFVGLSVLGALIALVAHDRLIPFDVPKFGLFQFGIDAHVYRAGGATVLNSSSLYAGNLVGELPFTYPPFAAIVFAPLALISTAGTDLLFGVGNMVLLFLIVRWSWKSLGFRDDRYLAAVSVSLALVATWLEPVRMTIWLEQINLALLALILWDLARPEGSRLRGIGVGIATGIKMTPGLFLIHLLLTRQWRAAVIGIAVTASTIALGFVVLYSDAATYWFGAVSDSSRIGDIGSGANQSLRAALPRWFDTDSVPIPLWLAVAGIVAVLGLVVAADAHRKGMPLLGLVVCGITAPLVSPFSWGHHWVWFLPLAVVCLDVALRSTRWIAWLLPVAAVIPQFAWFWVDPTGVYVIGTFMLRASSWIEFVMFTTAYPLTGLIVLVTVAVTLRTCDLRHITKGSRTGHEPTVDAASTA